MKLVGSGNQFRRDYNYFADGITTSITLPQLVLPEHNARSSLWLQNTSGTVMWVGMGSARATCTIAAGAVNAVTITNGGFNFTKPPTVSFLGGGIQPGAGQYPPNTAYLGGAGPSFPSPSRPAQGRAILTGNAVTSIVIDDPGAGYVRAPMVFMSNSDLDPYGCFNPAAIQNAAAGSGFQLFPGTSWSFDSTVCFTDPVAVFSATLNSTFACWWTT